MAVLIYIPRSPQDFPLIHIPIFSRLSPYPPLLNANHLPVSFQPITKQHAVRRPRSSQVPSPLSHCIYHINNLSALPLALSQTPAACTPTPTTITTTMLAPHSCYTATVTFPSPNIRCSAFNTKTCAPFECFRAETTSIPCPDACCPTTSTKTKYTGCQTTCVQACPTVTVSCGGSVERRG